MTVQTEDLFKKRGSALEVEQGTSFSPKLDDGGLIGAIVTDRDTGVVLMFAHMNAEAFAASLESGYAHFWSRSRGKLWKKGEESGNLLRIHEIRTDCDQDVLWVIATVEGEGVACHTGARSCFYRRIAPGSSPTNLHLDHVAPPKS